MSIRIGQPELCAVIGPNGAGKTTFMGIATGKTRPDVRRVVRGERSQSLLSMPESLTAQTGEVTAMMGMNGVGRTSLLKAIGGGIRSCLGGSSWTVWTLANRRPMRRRGGSALRRDDLRAVPGPAPDARPARGDLSGGQQQLAIARALMTRGEVLPSGRKDRIDRGRLPEMMPISSAGRLTVVNGRGPRTCYAGAWGLAGWVRAVRLRRPSDWGEKTMQTIRTALQALAVLAIAGAAPAAQAFTACQVTDTGGIDDNSFNQTAWKGVQDAQAQLGIEGRFLESQAETDYEANINSLLGGACDLIITVGFLLGDATKTAAEANPDQKFSIVDFAYDPAIPNVLGQVYATDQAAFLAGYLAAGMSRTGTVGTFGGINIPPVTIFMDGFVAGVNHHNAQKGTSVAVLGWDPATREGLFTNNFESLDDGRAFAQNLYDEGADIVLPVAGPVGLGSAALADELGSDALKIIGVDADLYLTDPENGQVYLTSIMKRMDSTVLQVIEMALNGTFEGGVIVGTLENGGVGLAPFHDFEDAVPAELKAELDTIRAGIVDGSIAVAP